MAKRKLTEVVKTNLRIREDLRRKLAAEAKRKEISLNREMATRLERSFVPDDETIDRIAERIAAKLKEGS